MPSRLALKPAGASGTARTSSGPSVIGGMRIGPGAGAPGAPPGAAVPPGDCADACEVHAAVSASAYVVIARAMRIMGSSEWFDVRRGLGCRGGFLVSFDLVIG